MKQLDKLEFIFFIILYLEEIGKQNLSVHKFVPGLNNLFTHNGIFVL